MSVRLNTKYLNGFVDSRELSAVSDEIGKACAFLREKNGPGIKRRSLYKHQAAW